MSTIHPRNGWTVQSLESIAEELIRRVPDPRTSGLDRFVSSSCIDRHDVRVARWESTADVVSAAKQFEPGDYLLVRRSLYATDFRERAPQADFAGVCSADILTIRERQGAVAPGFLQHLLYNKRFWDFIVANSTGSITRRIKWKQIAKYEFALPPIDEQKRIVDLLVALDRKIEAQRLAADKVNLLALSIFDSLVSTANAPATRLASVAEWRRGYSFKGSDYADDGGFPFLTLASVDRDGGYRSDGLKYLEREPKASCIAIPGDLLVANTDLTPGREFIGRPLLVPESLKKAGFSHHLSRIVTEDDSLREWLYWELQSPSSRRFVRSVARGSTVIMLDMKALGNWPVRIPPAPTRAEVLHRIQVAKTLEKRLRSQLVLTVNLRTAVLGALLGGSDVH